MAPIAFGGEAAVLDCGRLSASGGGELDADHVVVGGAADQVNRKAEGNAQDVVAGEGIPAARKDRCVRCARLDRGDEALERGDVEEEGIVGLAGEELDLVLAIAHQHLRGWRGVEGDRSCRGGIGGFLMTLEGQRDGRGLRIGRRGALGEAERDERIGLGVAGLFDVEAIADERIKRGEVAGLAGHDEAVRPCR